MGEPAEAFCIDLRGVQGHAVGACLSRWRARNSVGLGRAGVCILLGGGVCQAAVRTLGPWGFELPALAYVAPKEAHPALHAIAMAGARNGQVRGCFVELSQAAAWVALRARAVLLSRRPQVIAPELPEHEPFLGLPDLG